MFKTQSTSQLIRSLAAILATCCLISATASAQNQPPQIFETNFGTPLNLTDDSTTAVMFGSFVFPFAGSVFTGSDVLDISSNGFLSLGGSNGNDCCNGDLNEFLNDPFARISPLWADIDPANTAMDDVFIGTFNDDTDPEDDRLVVTWDAQHWGSGEDVLFQVQLLDTGVIVFGYNGVSALDRNTLIGITTGGGVADPGASDLSTGPFLDGGAEIYELFAPETPVISDPREFDLDFSNVVFTPVPVFGGFVVSHIEPIPEPSGLVAVAFALCAITTRRRR